LKRACEKHTANTRVCAKAQGFDRHLYALFSVYQRALDDDGAEAASSTGLSSNGYSSPVDAGSEYGSPPNRTSILSVDGDQPSNGVDHNSASSPTRPSNNQPAPTLFSDAGWDKLNNTIISTSNCGNPSLRQFGFGPTSGDGFGIGYIIKDDGISICASSKHRQTKRFVDALESYLLEIRRILRSTQRTKSGGDGKSSRVREASSNRPHLGSRLKSRGRLIRAGEPGKRTPGTMTPASESVAQSDDEEGLGGYGFFDAGMLLQALKARTEGLEGTGDGAKQQAKRREVGKKLRLSEY